MKKDIPNTVDMNKIPENMRFLFENPDRYVTAKAVEAFQDLKRRADNLKKNNGALVPEQWTARVFWIEYAYKHGIQLNTLAMRKAAQDLESVNIPTKYN